MEYLVCWKTLPLQRVLKPFITMGCLNNAGSVFYVAGYLFAVDSNLCKSQGFDGLCILETSMCEGECVLQFSLETWGI